MEYPDVEQLGKTENSMDESTLSKDINIGRRLFIDDTVHICEVYPSASKSLILCNIKLDEQPLCMVELYASVKTDEYGTSSRKEKGVPHVYRRPDGETPSDKKIVVHVRNIKGYAGMLESSLHANRYYLIYPEVSQKKLWKQI
ncbi:hypothetical protein BDA99DRAFT_538989 [Phascolomyces articulosus]|uniref:Uncharacterized protein n=1 Tax=Phascolomyces articulosus TaxID=60185 RepID=A0AAD5K6Y6_9FUNG|nr:hypothetical protein BDA99DRAFT_538989 [Phascolomyces articulosus]